MNNGTAPAFPNTDPKAPPSEFEWTQGLTKREHMATQIATGLCANHGSYGTHNGPHDVASRAVEIADALLLWLAK